MQRAPDRRPAPPQAIRAIKADACRDGTAGSPETDARLQRAAADPVAALAALCRDRIRKLDLPTLYAGLAPSAVETVASTVVYFYLYSLLRQAAVSVRRRRVASAGVGKARGDEIGVAASLLVAAAAGAGNMLVTTPAQVGGLAPSWGFHGFGKWLLTALRSAAISPCGSGCLRQPTQDSPQGPIGSNAATDARRISPQITHTHTHTCMYTCTH
jgi:hypothetical protein